MLFFRTEGAPAEPSPTAGGEAPAACMGDIVAERPVRERPSCPLQQAGQGVGIGVREELVGTDIGGCVDSLCVTSSAGS